MAQLVKCLPDPQNHIKQRSGISHPRTQKVGVEGLEIQCLPQLHESGANLVYIKPLCQKERDGGLAKSYPITSAPTENSYGNN